MIERFHRTLKSAIASQNNTQWTKVLPSVLLGIRASFKDDLKASAAEMLYGESIHLPGEFFQPSPTTNNDSNFLHN